MQPSSPTSPRMSDVISWVVGRGGLLGRPICDQCWGLEVSAVAGELDSMAHSQRCKCASPVVVESRLLAGGLEWPNRSVAIRETFVCCGVSTRIANTPFP